MFCFHHFLSMLCNLTGIGRLSYRAGLVNILKDFPASVCHNHFVFIFPEQKSKQYIPPDIHSEGLFRFHNESKWHWFRHIVWSSPLGRHLHLSSELERLPIHNWMNRLSPSPSLLLTGHPGFMYPKLSVKVIKKTSLKCQCTAIKLINGAHILCRSL